MGVVQIIELTEQEKLIARLRNWIAWCVTRDKPLLGYPSSAPYVRLMKPSDDARRSPKARPDERDALTIERAVMHLPDREKYIVTNQYLFEHLPYETRLRLLAQRGIAMQKSRYYEQLRRSELMIKNILTRPEFLAYYRQ